MFAHLYAYLEHILELSDENISVVAMIMRILIVYAFGIVILNVFNKRFIGERSPFDIILRFVVGSCLANAIVGSSPYFETLGMVFFIIAFHWILSFICFYSKFIERMLKGKATILYRNGTFDWKAMRYYHLTQEDILSEIRKNAGLTTLTAIDTIFLEDSGEVSIISRKKSKIHALQDIAED